MTNSYDQFRALTGLSEAMAQQDRYGHLFEQIERLNLASGPLFQQVELLSKLNLGMPGTTIRLGAELFSPGFLQTMENLARATEPFERFATIGESAQALNIHPSWGVEFAVTEAVKSLSASAELCLGLSATRLTKLSALTESRVFGLDWSNLGATVRLSEAAQAALTSQFEGLTSSYVGLLGDLERNSMLGLPEVVSAFPPIEMYRAVDVLETTTSEEEHDEELEEVDAEFAEEASASLPSLLGDHAPALLSMWHGAKHAVTSDNPDRGRHVCVSLRELVGHVLRELAPDEVVKAWTKDPEHFHNDRPKRSTRLLYICRHVDAPWFGPFVKRDVAAHVEFLDVLNKGTHRPDVPLEERHLRALQHRADALLFFLLSIHDSRD